MKRKTKTVRRRRQQRNKMDKYLCIIAATLALFTVTMIVIYCVTGGIPDTLCSCVFGALTGECGFMAIIKSFKEKYKGNDSESEDSESESDESGNG